MPQQSEQVQQNKTQAKNSDFQELVLPKVIEQKSIKFQDAFYENRSIEVKQSDKELYNLIKMAQESGFEILNLHGGKSSYRFSVQNKNGEEIGNFHVQLGTEEKMKSEVLSNLKNIVGDELGSRNAADNLMNDALSTELSKKVEIGKANVILKTLENIKQDTSHPIAINFPREEMKLEVKNLINFSQDDGSLVATHKTINDAEANAIFEVAKLESNLNRVVFKDSNSFDTTVLKGSRKDDFYIKQDQFVITDIRQKNPLGIVELTTVFSSDKSKVLGQSLVALNSDGNSSVLVKTASGEKFNLEIKEQEEFLKIKESNTKNTVTSESNFDKERLIRMAK